MRPTRTHDRRIFAVWLIALAALLPWLVFAHDFRQLYWFHDDWDMLDGASRLGLWHWLPQPFLNESIIPVSKLLWLAAVHLFNGSYFAMIGLLFAIHAVNVALYGEVLRRLELSSLSLAFSLVTFSLSWTNIETLGWSMQWISLAAMTFLLLAWLWLIAGAPVGPWRTGTWSLLLGASALSSSRGIVSGLLMALFERFTCRRTRLLLAALAPSFVLVVIMRFVTAGRPFPPFPKAAEYAVSYYLLNPLYLLLPIPAKTVDLTALLICGVAKLAILSAAWMRSPKYRPLFATLLCLDLLNAVSLGFARVGEGLEASVSYRYQYISLFCFGPFAGLLLERLPHRFSLVLLAFWIGLITIPWHRHAPRWAGWRGGAVRRALETTPSNEHLWPSHVTGARAHELVRQYHLH